jgi:hypothetical protein
VAAVRVEFAYLPAFSASAKGQVTAMRLAPTPNVTQPDLTMRVIEAARNLWCRTWRFAVLCWREREVHHDASSASPVL